MKKHIAGLLCAALLVTGTIPYLEVTAAESGHLIINQVYGNGDKTGAPVSHNFIEIYNPTEQVISLEGYSVEVSKDGNDGTEVELAGNIPAHTSYLVRGKESADGNGKCMLIQADFAIIEYKDAEADFVVQYRPRSLADGVQPDMVTFSPDGRYVMTADEGEPREGYAEGTTDPKGSVTLIILNRDNLAESEVKVYGVYMPDGLATVNISGIYYVITPNEGDAREWGD